MVVARVEQGRGLASRRDNLRPVAVKRWGANRVQVAAVRSLQVNWAQRLLATLQKTSC